MTTLDKIMELQATGLSETEIFKQLQNQGVSPKEINDALNNARIKTAVSQPENNFENSQMQQSIMQNPQEQIPEQEQQYPQYSPEQQPYQEQYYQPQPNYNTDIDTITEVAEQVVAEKFSQFTKKNGDILTFKNQVLDELSNLDERLKRIEQTIDKLQQAVVGKIGEFGENTNAIRRDLESLHNTTSKLMNPLIDNYKELQKIIGQK